MIREPCVAGMFYPGDFNSLLDIIDDLFSRVGDVEINESTRCISSVVVPHAGYVYSGLTASYAFKQLLYDRLPETIVIIGPNHTGIGREISVSTSNKWNTPLGDVDVDVEFCEELDKVDFNVTLDESAHIREHSIEVELPFLQYIANVNNSNFKIVPIIIGKQELKLCKNLAKSIYDVQNKLNRDCIVIASTDLTHYEDSETAEYLDKKVINSIEDMDSKQLIMDIIDYDISMCGYGPTITAITYAQLMNAYNSKCLRYSNSGQVSGDYDSVVGYTSAIIKK
ncbi:MAG: MEMO1 family protein [Methanosphaera stadtmanae]|jgi:hypothetical protein|nr:MEMO1 family protein [Methanosphaera stadtmanae]